MNLTIQEISTIIGLLVLFAGTVGIWRDQVNKVKANSHELKELTEKVNNICEPRSECTKQFKDIDTRIGHIENTLARIDQKLDDFIAWNKNGRQG